MKMVPVESSNIAAVGYSKKLETLRVEFHKGREYEYYPVSPELHSELVNAESVGKFFNENIKNNNNFTVKRLK
jgi:hypothetical protein